MRFLESSNFHWIFNGIVQFSLESSNFYWIFTGIVQWIFTGIVQFSDGMNVTFAISGVKYFALNITQYNTMDVHVCEIWCVIVVLYFYSYCVCSVLLLLNCVYAFSIRRLATFWCVIFCPELGEGLLPFGETAGQRDRRAELQCSMV